MVRTFRAENGRPGQGDRCFGRCGADVEIPVPPGTVIKDADTGELIKDLTGESRWVFLKGGKGGLGNWHFRSSTRQTPRFAQSGEKGQEMRIGVELLVIADIGFVGFPNAGKSSLLNLLTNARSKVAGYPFTTKIPQLGAMRYDGQDIILADIPGIIEGASQGAGMGFKFLRHISRTKALAVFIDLSDEGYLSSYSILMKELEQFAPALVSKPQVIIASKADEDLDGERLGLLRASLDGKEIHPLSVYMDETVEDGFKLIQQLHLVQQYGIHAVARDLFHQPGVKNIRVAKMPVFEGVKSNLYDLLRGRLFGEQVLFEQVEKQKRLAATADSGHNFD